MTFPLLAALAFCVPTLLLGALAGLVLWLLGRSRPSYWRAFGWLHLGLFAVHLFVTFPAALGYVGSRLIGTRPHERDYAGPRLDGSGRLLVQTWDSLAEEKRLRRVDLPADVVAAAAARARRIPSSDGVTVRAFRLEARAEPPRAAAVLVHGLFRSAMELEPVAGMLRDLGCECWLIELRNHGGSDRRPFSGGLRESDDVVAAVRFVRAQEGRAATPVVVFGVSLGTVAVSLALPRIDGIAGVVLDAPIDDLPAAAHRMLGFDRANDRRSFLRMAEPWQSLVLLALEQWSDFASTDVRPIEVLATLPHDLPVLVVGAGDDDRAPPDTVRALFERLPMPAPRKELWIRDGSGHGHVFLDAPEEYAARLRGLLQRLRLPR
jgi:alpha-beta hydrolase superfamily lysophospholipase